MCLNPDSACFHRCFQTFWLRTELDWHLPCCALRFIAPVRAIRKRIIKHGNLVNVANGIHNYGWRANNCISFETLTVSSDVLEVCNQGNRTNSRTWSAEKSAPGLRPVFGTWYHCIQMSNYRSKHHPRRIRTASIATGRTGTWLTLTCCRSAQIMKTTRVGVRRCSVLELPALPIVRSKNMYKQDEIVSGWVDMWMTAGDSSGCQCFTEHDRIRGSGGVHG